MPAAPYSVADYTAGLQKLLPSGRVWRRDLSTIQAAVIGFIAAAFARLDALAVSLFVGAFPPTADMLLPEWEESLGLPDPCAGPQPTIQQRQNQVLARFAGSSGQSVPFFIDFALKLGFVITIQEFTGTTTLANTWQVTVSNTGSAYFNAESSVDEPIDLVSTGAAVLQCEFARLKPAHTILQWNFI